MARHGHVIMFAYSAMKNMANLKLEYSVWKPGDQFGFRFGQIEGNAIRFRDGGREIAQEADNLWE